VVKIVACLILGICAQIPATSQTADSTLDRAEANAVPSQVPGSVDDQDFYAIPMRPVLRHHLVLPSPAPADPGQPRLKPKLRVATEAQPDTAKTGTGIVYTCASNVPTSTCNYLNTTVAGYYNNVFTNANADIYIQFGTTGLGASDGFVNLVHYAPYVTALTNKKAKSAIQASALSEINTYATPVYGTQNLVSVSVALGTALGFTGLIGVNAAGTASCTPYTSGCYNEVITVANAASQASGGFSLYYDDQGGTEAANQYDFYAVVQHETDEVLGTSSCISTQSNSGLTDECDGAFTGSNGIPSAVDLLRYLSPGKLAPDTTPRTTAGQYYSYDGGTDYGVDGDGGKPKVYNTLDNGDDFADYISSSPDCGTNQAVQDAEGCPGEDAGLTIVNDGQSEITILNTDGFDIPEAAITSPAPGSTLSGTSATFTWSAVTGAADYAITVGTTGLGSSNIYATPSTSGTTATSQAVTGLPTSGTIYVRVYSFVGEFWTSTDFTYTGGTSSGLTISRSPTALTFDSTTVGSTTAAQMVTIKNTGTGTVTLTSETITGTNATSFIKSATTCGASLAAAASCTVSVEFKPTAAGTLNANLSIADNATGSPQIVTLTGTGSSSSTAVLTSPTPGSTLPAGAVTFTWSPGTGATGYALWIGSTGAGSDNLYYSGEKASTVTSLTVSGLPANGETLYVRLITYDGSGSAFNSYTYKAAAGAALTSPTPGSTLAGSGVTFSWTAGAGATGYALWIGSTGAGSDNLYYSGEKASTVTSLAVSGLPVNGETIYVRLITYYGSSSSFINYTYTAATGAVLKTPTPGSTLTGSNVTFSWTAGAGASGYALWAGTASSGSDTDNLYYSGEKASTVTSLTVSGLPVNGETIYVRLITYYGTASSFTTYTFTAATAAVLKTPVPGSTLAGPSVTFGWTAAANATGYALWAGTASSGSDTDNLYYSGEKASTVTSLTVSGLPTNGETIYVRLITYYGSSNAFINYTYTAH